MIRLMKKISRTISAGTGVKKSGAGRNGKNSARAVGDFNVRSRNGKTNSSRSGFFDVRNRTSGKKRVGEIRGSQDISNENVKKISRKTSTILRAGGGSTFDRVKFGRKSSLLKQNSASGTVKIERNVALGEIKSKKNFNKKREGDGSLRSPHRFKISNQHESKTFLSAERRSSTSSPSDGPRRTTAANAFRRQSKKNSCTVSPQHMHALRKSQCNFVAGVASVKQMPRDLLSRPQIAFAGRSNVGKSSIINCLIGQRNLARVSKTPGRTQQINFFNVAGKMLLVDLPGYGYATVAQSMKSGWDRLMSYYFENAPQLKRVFLLVDARVGLKDSDHALMDFLDKLAVVYQIVLTKIDKISQIKETMVEDIIQQVQGEISHHPAAYGEILATSATKKNGISNFNRRIIECFA